MTKKKETDTEPYIQVCVLWNVSHLAAQTDAKSHRHQNRLDQAHTTIFFCDEATSPLHDQLSSLCPLTLSPGVAGQTLLPVCHEVLPLLPSPNFGLSGLPRQSTMQLIPSSPPLTPCAATPTEATHQLPAFLPPVPPNPLSSFSTLPSRSRLQRTSPQNPHHHTSHSTMQNPINNILRNTVAIADSRPFPGVDFHGIPNPPEGTPLKLRDLRERLIRQEETIIFGLIERAQFKQNLLVYTPGAFDLPPDCNCDGTFSQYLLYQLEKVYATVRRYTSPDEHPFAPQCALKPPILGRLEYPQTLCENDININVRIEREYRTYIVPGICEEGDDQNYGSCATCDVACLQALSKRIHYGKFIAEAKCQENEVRYRELASRRDRKGIWEELSNISVEKMLLKRVENKARSYGSDVTPDGVRDVYKVQPERIAELYRDFIIPLTKEVEIEYILQRYGFADKKNGKI